MNFKSGQKVRYSYHDFNYILELVERKDAEECDFGVHWNCKFLENLGPRTAWYTKDDGNSFPESCMTLLTPLEELL